MQWVVSILVAVYGAGNLVVPRKSIVLIDDGSHLTRMHAAIVGIVTDRSRTKSLPFLFGVVVLAATVILFFFGRSVPVLIVSRLLQGAAAAIVWVAGMALLTIKLPSDGVGSAIGLTMAALAAGELLGPVVGGVVYNVAGQPVVMIVALSLLGLDMLLRVFLVDSSADEPAHPDETRPILEAVERDGGDTYSSGLRRKESHQMLDAASRGRAESHDGRSGGKDHDRTAKSQEVAEYVDSSSREHDNDSRGKEQDVSNRREEHDDGSGRKAHDDNTKRKAHDGSTRQEEHDDGSSQKAHDDSSSRKAHDDSSSRKARDDSTRQEENYDTTRRDDYDDTSRKREHDTTAERGRGCSHDSSGRRNEPEGSGRGREPDRQTPGMLVLLKDPRVLASMLGPVAVMVVRSAFESVSQHLGASRPLTALEESTVDCIERVNYYALC